MARGGVANLLLGKTVVPAFKSDWQSIPCTICNHSKLPDGYKYRCPSCGWDGYHHGIPAWPENFQADMKGEFHAVINVVWTEKGQVMLGLSDPHGNGGIAYFAHVKVKA